MTVLGKRSFARLSSGFLCATILLGSCAWTQPGFDGGNSNVNPLEFLITAHNAADLRGRWNIDASTAGTFSSPIVVGGLLITIDTNAPGVAAYDINGCIDPFINTCTTKVWTFAAAAPSEIR